MQPPKPYSNVRAWARLPFLSHFQLEERQFMQICFHFDWQAPPLALMLQFCSLCWVQRVKICFPGGMSCDIQSCGTDHVLRGSSSAEGTAPESPSVSMGPVPRSRCHSVKGLYLLADWASTTRQSTAHSSGQRTYMCPGPSGFLWLTCSLSTFMPPLCDF
jgi:hypothetical protein